jgi:hypothetical protein
MARFVVRSGSVVFARPGEDPVSKRFQLTGANWREHRAHLPCRRSWVRVPSSAYETPVNRGFLYVERQRESPLSPKDSTRNFVPCGRTTFLTRGRPGSLR